MNSNRRGKYDDGTKMIFKILSKKIIFMNIVKQFKKYCHGTNVTPPPPPLHSTIVNNIIYLLCGKLGCIENNNNNNKKPIFIYDSRLFEEN